MPFPLAHPAAVLPLRKYCPRLLNFPALVAGTLSPDAGYLIRITSPGEFSHTLWGGLALGIPLGLVMLACGFALTRLILPWVPESYREPLLAMWRKPVGSGSAVIASLVIGIGTHLLLDSMTHKDGWIVRHTPFLHQEIVTLAGREIRVSHFLWYGCSFIGMAWLVLAFRKWQTAQNLGAHKTGQCWLLVEAVIIATLIVPIEILHHAMHNLIGDILVTFLSLILVVAIIARPKTGKRSAAMPTVFG